MSKPSSSKYRDDIPPPEQQHSTTALSPARSRSMIVFAARAVTPGRMSSTGTRSCRRSITTRTASASLVPGTQRCIVYKT